MKCGEDIIDNMDNEAGQNYGHKQAIHRRGPSSYWMHDPKAIFDSLALKPGNWFLDLGCGPGDYAIRASRIVGDSGIVYALDLSQAMIGEVRKKAARRGIKNIRAMVCDVTGSLPLGNDSIDICLLATVLHIPAVTGKMSALFSEVRRVLKPGGRFAIIECKKDHTRFGPPREMRLSPEDIEHSIRQGDFKKIEMVDLAYNYMVHFSVIKSIPDDLKGQ